MSGGQRRMSVVLWDSFTGSAHYRDIFLRTLHPGFLGRFIWHGLGGYFPLGHRNGEEKLS